MNILYLCDEYPPTVSGGIGISVKSLAEGMARLGNNVYVAGLYPSFRKIDFPYHVVNGVSVWKKTYFPLQSKYLSNSIINKLFKGYLQRQFDLYLQFLNTIIIEHDIQIVEIPDYQEIFFDTYDKIISYKFSIPIVIKTHGSYTYIAKLKNQVLNHSLLEKEKTLYSSASAIICLSQFSKSTVLDIYGQELISKMALIPHGIVLQNASQELFSNETKILFVGSLTKSKGIFQLMLAWNLVQRHSKQRIKLDVYGKYDPRVLAEVKSLIHKDYLDSICFHGHVCQDDLNAAYGSAYLAVFPSYFETFGMVAIEAMSNGCPVLFTNRTSGAEIIQDGKNGYLIDPDKPDRISERIIKLVDDPELRNQMSLNALKTVEEKYSMDKVLQRHVGLYEKLLV